MNILIIGAAGFIGTNLALKLIEDKNNKLTLIDKNACHFKILEDQNLDNVNIINSCVDCNTDFDKLLINQDLVFYLASTVIPSNSNQEIPQKLTENVLTATYFLEGCVRNRVKKVVFISSGGTVYGKSTSFPLKEDSPTDPICFYGAQKVMIEKLMYLYNYLYGLDYRIIRLANPYGPYQRPDGVLGVVSTFTYKALNNEEIVIYGDGSVVRDFIYIDDAIKGIMNITNGESKYKLFNLGSGHGTSIKELLQIVQKTLQLDVNIRYEKGRSSDVPINYLDISRYEEEYGNLASTSLEEGIQKTAKFLKKHY